MYEFHYDYMLPNCRVNLKLCYLDTDLLVYHIKTKDFCANIASNVELRFDRGEYDKVDARQFSIGLNKKVIGLMKDELGGKIMTEYIALRPKL